LSGFLGSSLSGYTGPLGISRSNSNRRSSIAAETAASSSANWSPTHFRVPPPKGRKAKSAAICVNLLLKLKSEIVVSYE
jgi:hypothetical protein